FIPLPALGQARLHRIGRVARPAQHRVVDNAAKSVEVVDATPGAVPDAAIDANAVNRIDDTRIVGKTFLDWRQLARGDLLRQHRGLAPPIAILRADTRQAWENKRGDEDEGDKGKRYTFCHLALLNNRKCLAKEGHKQVNLYTASFHGALGDV